MKLDVVLGLQWGDEGKGKIVDVLAGRYPAVARFQGGPNAGHSLHFDGHNFVVRSIPSGIFRDGSTNIIGSGVVLDPITFREECGNISKMHIEPKEKICISKKAHLILPTHRLLDAAYEAAAGKSKIGSSKRFRIEVGVQLKKRRRRSRSLFRRFMYRTQAWSISEPPVSTRLFA